ncbi:hypothetical protein V6N11_065044 [Hibiscus sabdariffa]|uniref:Uncharacterized protein n=1 Tax=Hibiscus sabdariffa TaxID=183260 RepID=A0ABR2SJP0_9ROSI
MDGIKRERGLLVKASNASLRRCASRNRKWEVGLDSLDDGGHGYKGDEVDRAMVGGLGFGENSRNSSTHSMILGHNINDVEQRVVGIQFKFVNMEYQL